MSKKKNTLNDLEEFLKLQASTLVPPQPVETAKPVEPSAEIDAAPVVEKSEAVKEPEVKTVVKTVEVEVVKPVDVLAEMKRLAAENKSGFYDNIIKVAESMPEGTNDILLINTALYLKHGTNWKSGIEEYWRKRKSAID